MAIAVGDRLPAATLLTMGEEGPEEVSLGHRVTGRKVAIFAVPGAYTPTCNDEHVPSFVRNAAALVEKGIDEIICISVNDPFVLNAWGKSTGASNAGIAMLSDPDGCFSESIGLSFSAEQYGLFGRSQRYSMLVEDGTVTRLEVEDSPGVCQKTSGDEMLLNC